MSVESLKIELWADDSIESTRLRRRLVNEGIPFREVPVDGSGLPAIRVDGAIYDDDGDINMTVEWLREVQRADKVQGT